MSSGASADIPAQVALPLQACLKTFLVSECDTTKRVATLGTRLALNGINTLRDFAFGYSPEEVSHVDSELGPLQKIADLQLSRQATKDGCMLADSPGTPQLHGKHAKVSLVVPPVPSSVEVSQPVAVPILPTRLSVVLDTNGRDCSKALDFAGKLVDIFLQSNQASTLWTMYRSLPTSLLQGQWLKSLQDHLADFDYHGLQQVVGTWEKWSKWCGSNGASLFAPDPVTMSSFIRASASTASGATSLRNKLRFLEIHLGLRLHVADVAVRRALRDKTAAPRVRSVVTPRGFLTMWCLATSKNKVVAYFAKFCLIMALGSPRFRHAQRSTLLEVKAAGLVFSASRGKVRKDGCAAPAFNWYVPHLNFCKSKLNLLSAFAAEWRALAGTCSYLMPGIKGTLLLEASEFTGSDMAPSQFYSFLNQLVAFVPLKHWPARQDPPVGARSCRRMMPTVADAIGMDIPRRYALGNWAAPEGAQGSSDSVMPLRYASEKEASAFAAKARCADAVVDALKLLATAREHATDEVNSATWKSCCTEKRGQKRATPGDPTSASESSSSSSASGSSGQSSSHVSTVRWLISPNSRLHRRAGPSTTKCGLVCKLCNIGSGLRDAKKRFPAATWCRKCALDLHLRTVDQP